ncbi:hypothetical protein LCGC14_0840240 [marine sediment metagenome]|uniref:Uncharacterized protein n=1 Tax=marine sediment metagenome TaxID=412755 RepID=A0A0F9PI29_9ZZZZ
MIFNCAVTAKSFKSEYWIQIFNLLHEDLDLDLLNQKSFPIPFLLQKYRDTLWKHKEKIGKVFLNPDNIKIVGLHRIWEFVQIIASIYHFSDNNLNNKKILSLGAGFEPCLFTLAKLGAEVYASDIYYSPNYWHSDLVKYIYEKPDVFCHYKNYKPDIKYLNLNLKSKKSFAKLDKFDIIYSVSSLEHIYSSFRKKKKLFKLIARHLNNNGILSLTTELIIEYEKKPMYTIYFNKFLRTLNKLIKKYNSRDNIDVIKSSDKEDLRTNAGTIKSRPKSDYFRKIFNILKNLPRDNRRYDFYTIEELLNIIRVLSKLKINLVENIDWNTCTENLVISKYPAKQFRTSISLTFLKE